MANGIQEQKGSSPTLKTVKMVEEVIEKADESALKISELKRRLPRKVNHNTLMQVLDYLQENQKVVVGTKGVTWIYNPDPKWLETLEKLHKM